MAGRMISHKKQGMVYNTCMYGYYNQAWYVIQNFNDVSRR